MLFLLLGGALVLTSLLFHYRSYYFASVGHQALQPEHALLRSSGRLGLTLGVAGFGLFFLNLTYLLRRRFLLAPWPGSLRTWMDLHVVTGLLGGGCILLHSAAGVRSTSGAIAAGALAIVVGAGLLGRYLYSFVPRTIDGREQELAEVETRLAAIRERLEGYGIAMPVRTAAESKSATLLATIGNLLLLPLRLRSARRKEWKRLQQAGVPPEVLAEIRPVLYQLVQLRDSLDRYHALRRLMASWRFLHRWLALVMVCAATGHIVVALLYSHVSLGEGNF